MDAAAQTTDGCLAHAQVKFRNALGSLAPIPGAVLRGHQVPGILWVGGGRSEEAAALHWGHRDGLRLRFVSASQRCVHEVTSLKPEWWAVTEELPDL